MTTRLEQQLHRRYAGAPESLARALRTALVDPELPRVTRKELARTLDDRPPAPSPTVGVVAFPVVAPGTDWGCVYRAFATDSPRHDLTPVPAELGDAVRTWLDTTLPRVGFAGLHLSLSGPPPGDAWSGRSCEAALAAAALSWALGVAPADVVVTGALGAPGAVTAVDHVDDKAALVRADRPSATLVHAGDADADTLWDAVLPGWRAARDHVARRSLLARARAAREALEAHDHARAADLAARVLAEDPDDDAVRARALWSRGAVHLHHGRADAGLADLDAAIACLPAWTDHADDPAEDLVAEELVAWSLVARIDTGRVREAWTLGTATLAALDGVARRGRRWRWVALQVAGSTHRAALALGDVVGAHVLLRDWALGRAVLADQRARSLGDHGEVRRRGGDVHGASIALHEARAALPDAGPGRAVTARFLDLLAARIDADATRPTPPARPDDPVWPGLAFALLACRRAAAARSELAALHALPAVRGSLPLQWVVGAEVAWHVLHGGAGKGLVDGLRRDVAGWQVDDPELAALLARLADRPEAVDLQAFRTRSPYG